MEETRKSLTEAENAAEAISQECERYRDSLSEAEKLSARLRSEMEDLHLANERLRGRVEELEAVLAGRLWKGAHQDQPNRPAAKRQHSNGQAPIQANLFRADSSPGSVRSCENCPMRVSADAPDGSKSKS